MESFPVNNFIEMLQCSFFIQKYKSHLFKSFCFILVALDVKPFGVFTLKGPNLTGTLPLWTNLP